MRRLLGHLLLLFALVGAPAWGATSLETNRAEARAARQKVNDVRARQMSLRMELNQVAARIQTLKEQDKGALLTGGELESSLRRSQELSGLLTTAAQEFSLAEAESERGQLALLQTLASELDALRNQWDRTPDRRARAKIVDQMRALREERDQVRALLPASKVPALDSTGSEDPEDLFEQADALRDSEDKVRQKMASLRTRIEELREEQELDRRMSDFLGDESLFDEQDRRLRRQSVREIAQGSSPPLASSEENGSATSILPPGQEPMRKDDGSAPSRTVSITQVARGSDSRPQLGGSQALLLESAGVGDVDSLQKQLEELESLSTQLRERADRIEAEAKELQ
ncbi:MAG: TetR family transcriptional regulator [Myxococcaceae bacterium]